MHQIENNFLKVRMREYGAELTSIFNKKTGIEHLWQADPAFWVWHAPVLFPVVGRCLNDEITINGTQYPMQKHGFARKSTFKLLELREEKATFSLTANAQTKQLYPYNFEFLISYLLKDNSLQCSYEVINKDTQPLYFQLGGHPAFAVPFRAGEEYEDYHIEFEQAETSLRHLINTEGFFDGRTEQVLNNSNQIPLTPNLFINDALIFKDLKSRKVTLKSKNHFHQLSVRFNAFQYLGLWAKPGANYVCIEPWLGCADTSNHPVEFSSREGVLALGENKTFNTSFIIMSS